jgi:hypothetical protein
VLSAVAATPKNIGDQTPGSQRTLAASTPGGATTSTLPGTPFRDQLNINPGAEGFRLSKKDLQHQFQQLPKPRNDFELAPVGEEDDEEEQWMGLVGVNYDY